MELKIFSVYDQAAKAYLPPFFLPEAGMAIRTFGQAVQSKDHQFGKNPEDYTLYEIGLFDDNTGEIKHHEVGIYCKSGLSFGKPNGEGPGTTETKEE